MPRWVAGQKISKTRAPPSNWKSSHHPRPSPPHNLTLEVLGVILSSSLLHIASHDQSYRSSVFRIPVAELLQLLNWSQKLVLKTAGGARAALDLLPREMKSSQSENTNGSQYNKSSLVVHLSVNILMRTQRLLETKMDSDEWSNDEVRTGRTTGSDRAILMKLGKSHIMNNLFNVVQGVRTAATDARNGLIFKALDFLHDLLSNQWVQMSTPSTIVIYCIDPLQVIVEIAVSGLTEDLVKSRAGDHGGEAARTWRNASMAHLKKLHDTIVLFCHIGFTANNPTMCQPQRQILGQLGSKVQAAIDALLDGNDGDDLVHYDQQYETTNQQQHQEAVVPPINAYVSPGSATTPPIDPRLNQRISHSPPSSYPVSQEHKPSHQEQRDVSSEALNCQLQQPRTPLSSEESRNWRNERDIIRPLPSTGSVIEHNNKRQKLKQPNHSSECPEVSMSTSGPMPGSSHLQENGSARLAVTTTPGTQPQHEQYRKSLTSQGGGKLEHSTINIKSGRGSGAGDGDVGNLQRQRFPPLHLPGANAAASGPPIMASGNPVHESEAPVGIPIGIALKTPLQHDNVKKGGSSGRLEMLDNSSGLAATEKVCGIPLSDDTGHPSVTNATLDESFGEIHVKINRKRKPKFSLNVKVVKFPPWINEIPSSAVNHRNGGTKPGGGDGLGFENDIVSTRPIRDDSKLIHNFKYRNKTKALASGCQICAEKSKPICNRCLNCIACYNKFQMPCSATRIAGVSSSDAGEAETFSKEGKGLSATLMHRMDRAVHKAFTSKDFDPIYSLVHYQSDLVNFQRSTGETALHAAVFAGDMVAVKKLLYLGGNPTLRDSNGNDAAAMAFVSTHGIFPELAALVSKTSQTLPQPSYRSQS